ncbi:MAG: 50S ribosomal protein L23 [Gemmatimonadales bacterium]|jgi:large subunit ribosomal protein L23|nr:MAG: 50S ribosomal protein L23 [Gemmatimonadales bacterium]
MRDAYDIIKRPIITEKSATQIEEENVYAFVVDNGANKLEIAHAVEKIWDVKVEAVRTMRYAGKMRRSLMGRMSRSRNVGRRPSFKKALVTLAEGDHIEFYEVG